ncbi:MAG: LUD domain-containing protein [Patescibacteria group bacterium]|jgi:hypothetical protein
MTNWNILADEAAIQKTATALEANGIKVIIINSGQEAKAKVMELIPQGSEVMTMASQTLVGLGLVDEFNESGKYNSIKKKFASMDPKKDQVEMSRLGAGPAFAVGSVHAVTEDGHVIVVSATGSQLPAYAYSAMNVIWVVGAQKIVKNLDDGFKRIDEHVFPLEDVRALKVYGGHSGVNKTLIINKEVEPNRLTMIIVKEVLGF